MTDTNGWYPIDTAPRNGELVSLCWMENGVVQEVYHNMVWNQFASNPLVQSGKEILMLEQAFVPSDCVVFYRTKEKNGEFSNMCAGFPIHANGYKFRTSEALYQAFKFPDSPSVQMDIATAASPMQCKFISRAHSDDLVNNWDSYRLAVMEYAISAKACCNPSFAKALIATGDSTIVEKSSKDTFWGGSRTKRRNPSRAKRLGKAAYEPSTAAPIENVCAGHTDWISVASVWKFPSSIHVGCRMTRVLVCGGRDFADAKLLNKVMDDEHKKYKFSILIHGDAKGADRMSGTWASNNMITVMRFPAEWERFGNKAGHYRNCKMLLAEPELVIAFPGGVGTADMVRLARGKRIPVIEVAHDH